MHGLGSMRSAFFTLVSLFYQELRATGYSMDEGLARLAAEVKKNSQDVAGVLERAGVTPEEFAQRALEEARRLQRTVDGWNIPPGGG